MGGTTMVLAWVWTWQAFSAVGCGIVLMAVFAIVLMADHPRMPTAIISVSVPVFVAVALAVSFLSMAAVNESRHADYRESRAECHQLLDAARVSLHATPWETARTVNVSLTRGNASAALRDAIAEVGCPTSHMVDEHANSWARQTAERENAARVAEALTRAWAIQPLDPSGPAQGNVPPVDPSASRAIAALVADGHRAD